MTEPPDGKWETAEEVLEREIQELEQPFRKSWTTWIASLVAAALLGGVLTLLVMPGTPTFPGGKPVRLIEPRQGSIAQVPRDFRWAPLSDATAYIVSVSRADNGDVVMLRSTSEPRMTTLDTEVSRFDAGRYVWVVEAHGRDGSTVGRGEGGFVLTMGE